MWGYPHAGPTVPSFQSSAPKQFSHLVNPSPATGLFLTRKESVPFARHGRRSGVPVTTQRLKDVRTAASASLTSPSRSPGVGYGSACHDCSQGRNKEEGRRAEAAAALDRIGRRWRGRGRGRHGDRDSVSVVSSVLRPWAAPPGCL